jgi:hypothetical protein
MKYFLVILTGLNSLIVFGQNKTEAEQKAFDLQKLKDRVNAASLVIEGKVISQQGIWNQTHTLVFTSNLIQVYKLFKGKVKSDTIEIIELGGNVDGVVDVNRDAYYLGPDEEGIFFLKVNDLNARTDTSIDSYRMQQEEHYGLVRYFQDTINPPVLYGNTKFSKPAELYPIISAYTGARYKVYDINPRDVPPPKKGRK